MHPYRTSPAAAQAPSGAPAEEWILGGLLVGIGGLRVIVALATGEELAADVTIAAIVAVLGLVVLAGLIARSLTRP